MKKKLAKKFIITSIIVFFINLSSYAGISSIMPYMILNTSCSINSNITAGESGNNQDDFSLYNEVSPAQLYTLNNGMSNGIMQNDLSGNSLILAQESLLCNSIFRNNN